MYENPLQKESMVLIFSAFSDAYRAGAQNVLIRKCARYPENTGSAP